MNILISLVKKDLYTLGKSARSLVIFLLIYSAVLLIMGNLSLLPSVATVICAMLPLSSFSYDDFAKWNNYALTMPVSRNLLALSKYILLLAVVFASSVLSILFWVLSHIPIGGTADVISLTELLASWEAAAVTILLAHSLTFPLVIRHGTERGRTVFFTLCLCAALLIVLGEKYLDTGIAASIDLESALKTFLTVAPFIAALILFLSYRVSAAILEKKEF